MNDKSSQELMQQAADFDGKLTAIKNGTQSVNWYPYNSMGNMGHLCTILPSSISNQLAAGDLGWRVLDVGAADGDLGYFFESRGNRIDFIDNPPTNYNDCKGIERLRDCLNSESRLLTLDIDRHMDLDGQYDFAIALGLLYHLRNPMAFLMGLAEHAERMVLSTRVANRLPDGTKIGQSSVAYLLRARESNNDPTNYWVFSPTGLTVALQRCGWNLKTSSLLGAKRSNPVENNADQRMFVYCERTANWRDLGKHHDF